MMFPSQPKRIRAFLSVALIVVAIVACSSAKIPPSQHVVIVMLENHSYSQVIGNASAPYMNSLAKTYGLATNYDANSHYSIPDYFWVTTGAYVTTSDRTTKTFDVDNVTRYLLAAGLTWKAYEESIPSVGYTGPTIEPYERNHDPFSYLTDVVNSSQRNNLVPFTQLATDIANDQLPNYSFITPNSTHDGHNGTMATVDRWLKTNLAPLLHSSYFQPGGDGLLIITFDESVDSDCAPLASCPKLPENKGGGHIATIVVGPNVTPGTKSTTFYQHPSALRTMLTALGISGGPGASAGAPVMADFFKGSVGTACQGTGANQTITMCSPGSGATVSSPAQIIATATDNKPVNFSQIYLDGVNQMTVLSSTVNISLPMSSGAHRLTVQANDGISFKTTIYITVH